MKDPADVYAIDELVRLLGTRVIPVYAEPVRIEECLDYAYGGPDEPEEATPELEEIVDNAGLLTYAGL